MRDFNSKLVACTIATKNHLSKVRVLTDSFLRYHPNSKLFLLLVDEVEGYFEPNREAFHLVRLENLGIPNLYQFLFKYTALELCTAVKAFFLEYLLKKFGCRKIVYFDDDILVTNSLESLSNLLDHHAIVLTPHLLEPVGDDRSPNQLNISFAGTYNLGFLTIADTQTTRAFLEWWKSRLYNYCRMDPTRGLFVDQKWVELALGFFDGIHILRDPGYNVAYWNMGRRRLSVVGKNYFVNGRPLRFFHFSGFDPERPERISKYQDQWYTFSELPEYRSLFMTYRQLLNSAEYEKVSRWPWTYGYFDNGAKIPDDARRTYYNSKQLQRKYPNPFSTSSQDNYFHWWNTRLKHEIPIIIAKSVRLARQMGIKSLVHEVAVKIMNTEI